MTPHECFDKRWEPRQRGARACAVRGKSADVRKHAIRIGWSFRRAQAAGGKPVGPNPHPGAHINQTRSGRSSGLPSSSSADLPEHKAQWRMAESSGLQQRGLRRNDCNGSVTGFPFNIVFKFEQCTRIFIITRNMGGGFATCCTFQGPSTTGFHLPLQDVSSSTLWPAWQKWNVS